MQLPNLQPSRSINTHCYILINARHWSRVNKTAPAWFGRETSISSLISGPRLIYRDQNERNLFPAPHRQTPGRPEFMVLHVNLSPGSLRQFTVLLFKAWENIVAIKKKNIILPFRDYNSECTAKHKPTTWLPNTKSGLSLHEHSTESCGRQNQTK